MSVPVEVLAALDAVACGNPARGLENEVLDFKTVGRSVADTLRDLAEAAACFANGRGGSIVVGVSDRGSGSDAFIGCQLDPRKVQRRVYELTEPRLTVMADTVQRAGSTLLVLTVPSSPDVHAVGGRSTERVAQSCEPMSTARIATVVAERRGDDWSAGETDVAIRSTDPYAVALARSLLERSPDQQRRRHARESDQDLLRILGVVTARGTLTAAGALLLTRWPERGEQLVYVHRRTPAGSLLVNEHLATPLLPAISRVFDLIDARLDRTSINLPGGQQLQVADLPDTAVREAVINAVMHRDYRRLGCVNIEHTATQLTVVSPGPFVTGVTVDNVLTTSSRSRNPSLAGAVRILGLAETAGTGVDRMYAEMARLGHQPPTFTADVNGVRVALLGGAPNAHLARFASTLPAGEAEDADTLLTLLMLLTRRTVSAATLSPVLQKPVDEVAAVLDRLGSEPIALLEPTRESARSPRPTYRLREHAVASLGPAVAYRRRTTDEYDRKIIELVREAGEVNARMVKLLLDLDAAPASRVLADLVERGILVKTSTARRGPSVTYGAGPAMPRRARRGRAEPSG